MTTRRAAETRVEDKIANVGVPPQCNHDPSQEKIPLGCQASINPQVMIDREIKVIFLNMTQAMAP